MAASQKKKASQNLIDPIYEKFTKSILRTLGSTQFYEYFMDTMSRGKNTFQFSNRKLEKLVDLRWVDAIEESLEGFQNIIENPRNIIREEEIIVNVANAKKAGPDVVRHLAQHGAMVENFDVETGDVRPSRLMQKLRDDSTELYENRLVFTVLEQAYHFVQIRHNALFDAMSEEYGAKLKVESELDSAKELVHMDMFLHIKGKDSALEVDEKNQEVFNRISRIHRLLTSFMYSQFAEQMKQVNRVKGNITKTNVLKKNPNYKKIVKLWEFLRSYNDVGYMIKVTEQNPVVDERLQQDIFHNIMFQYIILKGYLEDEEDRAISQPLKQRKRTLKPKVIKQIIEELTEDYDLPDVEVRKVLIEALTKEQLLQEPEEEQDRLIAEALARKQEEEARLREQEEAEAEALRKEQKEEEERELRIRMERELEDRRRTSLFMAEVDFFQSKRLERLQMRQEALHKLQETEPVQDYADVAWKLQEEERKKWETQERIRLRKEEEERRRIQREEELREQRRKAQEAEAERIRLEKEAEAERLRQEQERQQIARDLAALGACLAQIEEFRQQMEDRKRLRAESDEAYRIAFEEASRELSRSNENRQGNRRRFGSR